ncbi:MAG: sulfite exporter TauE/SafE family protein [Myxococcales bacterium]|jgi:uncharacterized membrane protein YfcA|nr:sulfite exporter TauE/SafE family protein [Myxococcales bacterium]
MSDSLVLLSSGAFFVVAFLYASVGHAGASGYLAVMALLSHAPETIKPISLLMNCVVATIASVAFIRAGHFDGRVLLPFAVTSIPLAFLGGTLRLDPALFRTFAGVFLLGASLLLFLREHLRPRDEPRPVRLPLALTLGAGIGVVSGMLGVGGGIFLTPLLIVLGWAPVKTAAGVSALFILCNSLMGLLGHVSEFAELPLATLPFCGAALAGGYLGAHLGATRLDPRVVHWILRIVLLGAGLKFLLVR